MTDEQVHGDDAPRGTFARRREAMLAELVTAMRRRHRRRRLSRRLAATCGLLLMAAGAAWGLQGQLTPPPARDGDDDTRLTQRPQGPVVKLVRHSLRTGLVRLIDDDELLERLAEIDRSTGLIRADGRIWLTEEVTDSQRDRSGHWRRY